MCNCQNINPGSEECYSQQVVVPIPDHMESYKQSRVDAGNSDTICLDPCIEKEILYLWQLGISTYGSCCGHNKLDPMVNVDKKDIYFMLALGYEQNHPDKDRKDTFKLKSV